MDSWQNPKCEWYNFFYPKKESVEKPNEGVLLIVRTLNEYIRP